MKTFLIYFTLIISSFCFSQTKRFSLQLKTNDKTSLHGASFWKEAKISSKDTSFMYQLHSLRNDKIENLPSGDFTISIFSLFGQKVSKKVSLKKNLTVKFKLEKLNKKISPTVFSSKMKEGDTLYILHNASGMKLSKIGIIVLKNNYYALPQKTVSVFYTYEKTKMNDGALKFLQQTETEAPAYNKSSGCTAIETYTFQLNGKYYSINDGTCKWMRFSKLASVLFPVSED